MLCVIRLKKLILFLSLIALMLILCECTKETSNNYVLQLGDYKNLVKPAINVSVSNKECVDEQNFKLKKYATQKKVSNRGITYNDIIIMDYNIKVDGVDFNSSKASGYEYIVGSGDFSQEFDKKIMGATTGAILQFQIRFPADFPVDSIKGKWADFNVKINTIFEYVNPILTNEFVYREFGFKTISEFNQSVRNDVYSIKVDTEIKRVQDEMLQTIIKRTKFADNVTTLYDSKYQELMNQYREYAKLYHISLSECLGSFDLNERKVYQNACKFVNEKLVVDEIIKRENLKLSQNDFELKALEHVQSLGYDKISDFTNDNGEEFLSDEIYKEIVMDYIYSHSQEVV